MTSLAAMVNHSSDSPSPSELYYNLDQLRDFNSTTPFQQQAYGPDSSAALHLSHPTSAYGSPALDHQSLTPDPSTYLDQYANPYSNIGLGIECRGYPAPPPGYYAADQSNFFGTPIQQDTAPPTPRSTPSDAVRRTRSSRSTGRSESPGVFKGDASKTRVTKTKAKAAKANKTNLKMPKITAPLSELTADMTDVPVRDMEAWVHRSLAERQREVEKRNGYVTRPMNSFMLYRSAYAERTKQWCLQNNHQVVSSVSGESWPMEPPEIRDKYNNFAKIERENHARAHPSYKFSPSKVPGANRKKKEYDSEEEDDELSDSDDPDFEWKPRTERRGRSKTSRRPKHIDSASPELSHFEDDAFYPSNANFSDPMWHLSNMNRPLPSQFESSPFQDSYFPSPSAHEMLTTGMDEIQLQPFGYESSFTNAAMPSSFNSLAQPQANVPMPFDSHVDPMLLHREHQSSYNMFDPIMDLNHFGEDMNLHGSDFTSMEPTSQFDEWMEHHNA